MLSMVVAVAVVGVVVVVVSVVSRRKWQSIWRKEGKERANAERQLDFIDRDSIRLIVF